MTKNSGLYLGDEKKGDFTKIDAENKQAWAYDIDLSAAGAELEIWYDGEIVTGVTLEADSTDKVTLTADFKLKISDVADLSNSIINVLYKYEQKSILVREVTKADIQTDDGIYIGDTKAGALAQNVAEEEVMASNVTIPSGGTTALTIRLGGETVSISNFAKSEHVKATLADDKQTITIAAGAYAFYYSYTGVAGQANYQKLWIEGTSTENLPSGETDPPETQKDAYYKIGTNGEQTLIGQPDTLTQQDITDGIEIQYSIKEKQLTEGDKLYFTVGEQSMTFLVEEACSGVKNAGNEAEYVEIAKSGKFDISLKKKNGKWQLYATRERDPEEEITKPATDVQPNSAYLVGKIAGSDATWDNSGTKGIALTQKTEGSVIYELTIELTEGDNVKFYKTGATTETKNWVGAVATANIDSFMTSGDNGANITIKATGKFKFVVDFAKKSIYVSYSADGEPTEPEVPQRPTVQLRGEYNGTTDWSNGWDMTAVEPTDSAIEKYQIEVTVEAGKSLVFKVVYDGSNWIDTVHGYSPEKPGWSDGNLKLSEGKYVISLLVWKIGQDWNIYIEKKS